MRGAMLRMHTTRVCIILVACAVFAQDRPGERVRQWGEQSGPYRLSILSDKDEYVNGTPVKITCTVKNVTDRPGFISTGTSAISGYKITVKIPVHEWMNWTPTAALLPRGIEGSTWWRLLDAGDEISRDIDLAEWYDLSKPGKYRVTFSRQATARRNDPARVELVSNEITFTVLPRQ